MAYMYRADRTQDGVDSGRVSPSGPFSPDDAMRRRSSRRLLSFLNSPRDAPANVPRQESMVSAVARALRGSQPRERAEEGDAADCRLSQPARCLRGAGRAKTID